MLEQVITTPASNSRLSVSLGGRAINVSAMARILGVDQGSLSKFLSGNREPSLTYAKRVASVLDWTLDDLLSAIEARKTELQLQ